MVQGLQSKFERETDNDKKGLYNRLLTKISTAIGITETAINNSSSKPQDADALKDVQKVQAAFASEFLCCKNLLYSVSRFEFIKYLLSYA